MVTANSSIVFFDSAARLPSALSAFMWRWGTVLSKNNRNSIPSQKPPAAGRKLHAPSAADWSMAGSSRLHTDAATITPAAKPVSAFCSPGMISRFMKNTSAAPSDVPMNGIAMPRMASFISSHPFIYPVALWQIGI